MNPIQQRQAAQAGDITVTTPMPSSNPLFLFTSMFCYLPFLFRELIFFLVHGSRTKTQKTLR